jgi:NAD+ kinase
MKPEPIRRVGLIANAEKPGVGRLLGRAAELLAARGIAVSADAATARLLPRGTARAATCARVAAGVDLLLVFGGDGTILRVVREIAGQPTPLLGIHVGRLGFLAEVSADRLERAVEQLAEGDFTLEERPLIEAAVAGRRTRLAALNDFVLSRGVVSRMIELEVAVDGEELTRYRCDGLIVSSPTGSTAYSLAAGGAIVSPGAPVFTLTPICPHTLSNRSVIVALEAEVAVRVLSERLPVQLTADGQVQVELSAGDRVIVRRSARAVRLLHPGGSSFFRTLRQKLHWSGSND